MNKIVTRINWVNDTDPAINDTHLNQMDSELDAIDDRVISMETDVIQQAENAEAWANGTRGGEAIDPSDPAYHKDAKYQAGQAASSASAAATSETNAGGSASAAGSSATAASGSANTASQKALDAEAWANGTRNGSPIPPTDPAYQKYSKWWAEHGANSLAGLTDVNITSPQDGDVLTYDSVTQKWINVAAPATVTITLTINGAKEDTVSIYDSNSTLLGTCAFESNSSSGTFSATVAADYSDTWTLTSTTTSYSTTKAISALSPTETVNVYPSNYLLWHGNNIGQFKAYASPGHGSANLTESISGLTLSYTGGGSGSIITDIEIDLTGINTITFDGTWTNVNYYGVSVLSTKTPASQYIHADAVKSNFYDQSLVLDVSNLSGNYYIACSCENNPSKTSSYSCTSIYLS